MNEITPDHLARKAIVYVRQSSEHQVRHNTGSREWQYGLKARAEALGWTEVTVIDQDLGISGSGAATRPGFEIMLDAVCNREVGIILSVDATRLSRNGREWHTLLEFCGVVGCLLADEQTVYDPRLPTDRMVLGLHGTMSELELANMRRRSIEGRNRKAARGELFLAVAAGYRRVGRNAIEKDPDLRVRAAIDLVFAKFDELQSIRQVHLWFSDEGLELPSQPTGEKELRWRVPNYGRVHGILTNPVFAGAYAYGRTESQAEIRDGEKKVTRKVVSDRDAWQVFIPDNHEGYISLETYERNRRVIADNSTKMAPSGRRGAVRSGAALLGGLVRCGHCGRKMTVTYSGTRGTVLRYICHSGMINHNEPKCISFSGAPADEAVGREIVRILEPIGLEAAVRVIEDDANAGSEAVRQHEIALERARYEAHRAWQQYDAVDPGNRQVAGELERRWNERLIAVQAVEAALEHARAAHADMRMDEEEREACLQLGADLERAWNHEGVTAETRKRILRAAIEEVMAWVEDRRVRLLVHWRGGDHTELFVAKRATGRHRHVTDAETGALITGLARQMPDMAIAALLNRLGRRTGKGHSWRQASVCSFRNKRGIPFYREGERQERGEMTLIEAATALRVDYQKARRLIQEGRLPARQLCKGAPWIISAADVERLCAGARPETPQLALFDDTAPGHEEPDEG